MIGLQIHPTGGIISWTATSKQQSWNTPFCGCTRFMSCDLFFALRLYRNDVTWLVSIFLYLLQRMPNRPIQPSVSQFISGATVHVCSNLNSLFPSCLACALIVEGSFMFFLGTKMAIKHLVKFNPWNPMIHLWPYWSSSPVFRHMPKITLYIHVYCLHIIFLS